MDKPTPSSLRAAPFDDLVKQICTNNVDPMYTHEFLQLLHKYAPRQRLFECIKGLTNHYSTVYGSLRLLLQWCSHFFYRDFQDRLKGKLYSLLIKISQTLRKNTLGSTIFFSDCTLVLNRIKLCVIRVSKPKVPTPRVSVVTKPSTKGITAHSAKEVAEQLTKLEHILFSQIPIHDFALYPKEVSAKIKSFVERCNNITNWMISHITRRMNNPLPVLKYFVKVAYHCERLSNYNSTFELVSCFSVYELKGILKAYPLPSKYKHRLDALEQLFDPLGNHRQYRAALRQRQDLAERKKRPFLPYMGILLKDLTVINEANPDHIGESINVDKIGLLGGIFRTIRVCHSTLYDNVIPTVNRGLYDSLLSLDLAPAKNINRLSLAFRNKKLMDTIIQGTAPEISGLPPVCSSGTLSTSDGPATLSTFIDFLATSTTPN